MLAFEAQTGVEGPRHKPRCPPRTLARWGRNRGPRRARLRGGVETRGSAYATTPEPEHLWNAVLARDVTADFLYGVRSTGVYCKPSCPSRRPRRESVSFFSSPEVAEIAGYRECRRCRPRQGKTAPAGLAQVRDACTFIAEHSDRPITLAQLAERVHTSPFHFRRVFTKIVGISPRAYQDALRARRFRGELRSGTAVSAAVYDAGYGSISRVYEHSPTGRGMTPARHQRGGRGELITYALVDSALGRLLIGATSKGICSVMLGDKEDRLEAELRAEYPNATLTRDESAFTAWARGIIAHLTAGDHTWICRWTSRARPSSGRCGATCSRFPTAKRDRTARLPVRSARHRLFVPWPARARRTRLASSSRATAWSARTGMCQATGGAWSARRRCSRKRPLICDL